MFLSELMTYVNENSSKSTQSIRSLLCFYKDLIDLDPLYNNAIPDAFKRLRVLDSKSFKHFNGFPPLLTTMIHLRYITLYVDQLNLIPEPMAKLWNLQTLVVETTSGTITMEANLWRMVRLRHLKTKAAIVLNDKNWEGKAGENLQTLSNLSPQSCKGSVSKRARNINKLGILGKLADVDPKFLANLCHLQRLKLVNGNFFESPNNDKKFNLVEWDGFPRSLKRLTLRKTSLQWSDMCKVAELKSLEVLKLKEKAFTGPTWDADGLSFPCLQFLLIKNADLANWKASVKEFPALTCLSLKNCEQLKKIPMALAPNLLKLDLEFCRSAAESARKIQKKNLNDQENQKLKYGSNKFQLNLGNGCV